MMSPGYGYYGVFGMGGSFMMILILVAIGFLVYISINNKREYQSISGQVASSNAIEIAKSRLARGEISIEEFEQIQKNLL